MFKRVKKKLRCKINKSELMVQESKKEENSRNSDRNRKLEKES